MGKTSARAAVATVVGARQRERVAAVWVPITELRAWDKNPRRIPEDVVRRVADSIERFGFANPILARLDDGEVIAGHNRMLAARLLGITTVPVRYMDLTVEEAHLLAIADNKLGEASSWDEALLLEVLDGLKQQGTAAIEVTGFDAEAIDALLKAAGETAAGALPPGAPGVGVAYGSLAARFGVPPFSVLDARQGYWQDRKRAWLSLGFVSEAGREEDLTFRFHGKGEFAEIARERSMGGTSIFDPVVCELAYRWFCPPGGTVLDPFAGGSVRGIVAAHLGRHYIGIDLSATQVATNEEQWARVAPAPSAGGAAGVDVPTADPRALTPVQCRDGVWFKRDDLLQVAGVAGGKVRTCLALATAGLAGRPRGTGLITAGSRASPQVNIVAHIAAHLGVPARCHTPQGKLLPEVQAAVVAGAEVVQHTAGYNNVIIARAREDAAARGWVEIPFGMECQEAVAQTRRQVANLPPGVQRIIVPVGSGMSLAGILHGLRDTGRTDVVVLGITVGADPGARLDAYAPPGWRAMATLVPAGSDYHVPAEVTALCGVELDAHYEAKCIPFVAAGDLLWVVGIRATAQAAPPAPAPPAPAPLPNPVVPPRWRVGDSRDIPALCANDPAVDFVFSCPPYADLEQYSEDERDLSNLAYADFVAAYRAIVAHACVRLRPDRFACFVVGDVRGADGCYYNFVSDTISAFLAAGLRLYNEAVLVTAGGTLALRVGRQFVAGRKLGKSHQNVLVFVKGSPRRAVEACGPVEVVEVGGNNVVDGESEREE